VIEQTAKEASTHKMWESITFIYNMGMGKGRDGVYVGQRGTYGMGKMHEIGKGYPAFLFAFTCP